jgi:hypothetical protein
LLVLFFFPICPRLTFLNDEVAQDEDGGVATVEVVAAEDVLAVDGEAKAREQLERAAGDQHETGRVGLRGAVVETVGHRQHGDAHRHRPHQVQQRQHQEHSPTHDKSAKFIGCE